MRPITLEELVSAISSLKYCKAAGVDNIYSEFVKYFGAKIEKWLLNFYNNIMVN